MSGIAEKTLSVLEQILAAIQNGGTVSLNGTNSALSTAPAATATADPAAPAAANTEAAGEEELDTRGFPYDSRIHGGTKGKNQDGSWTYKRGTPPELKQQVEDEMRQAGYGAADASAPTPAATPNAAGGVVAAPVVAAPPVTPPSAIVPPPVPAAKIKVEFPVIESAESMDENALIQTGAALISKHDEGTLVRLLKAFGVEEGNPVTSLPVEHQYNFYVYAASDEYLATLAGVLAK